MSARKVIPLRPADGLVEYFAVRPAPRPGKIIVGSAYTGEWEELNPGELAKRQRLWEELQARTRMIAGQNAVLRRQRIQKRWDERKRLRAEAEEARLRAEAEEARLRAEKAARARQTKPARDKRWPIPVVKLKQLRRQLRLRPSITNVELASLLEVNRKTIARWREREGI